MGIEEKQNDYEKLRENEKQRLGIKSYKASNDSLYNQGVKDFAQNMDYTNACKYYLLCNGY